MAATSADPRVEGDGVSLIGETRECCTGQSFLWLIVAVSCIGGLLFGYDTGVVSGASVLLQSHFDLSAIQLEAVVSSTILFAAASSLYSGSLNSRFGRRPTIVFASIVFVLGAAAMALATSFETLVLGRVIVGVAVGLSSGTVPLFIAELAPTRLRGKLVALNNVCIVSGQVFAGIIDGSFATYPNGWRWMLGLGGVPALIQLIGLIFLPESPRWLLEKGRVEQARAVMRRARPRTISSEAQIDTEIEEMKDCIRAEKRADKALEEEEEAGVTGVAGAAMARAAASVESFGGAAAHAAGAATTIVAVTASESHNTTAQRWKQTSGLTTDDSVRDAHSADDAIAAPTDVTGTEAAEAATGTGGADEPVRNGEVSPVSSRGADATSSTYISRHEKTHRATTPVTTEAGGAQRCGSSSCLKIFHVLYPVRKQLQLGVGMMLLQQLVGINTIMYYSTPILKQAFYSGDPDVSAEERAFVIWLSAPVACGQLIGCLVGMHLIDRAGRRPLVLRSIFLCAVTLFFMGANFFVDQHFCDGALADGGRRRAQEIASASLDSSTASDKESAVCALTGWFSLVGMVFYLISFGLGMSPIPWALNAELYPLGVRSICVGIATATNWISNFVVAATFLSLEEMLGPAGTFSLYGGFALCGFFWLWWRMPETAGKSLEEIEELFR